jgi:hypothetical protein
MLQLRTTLPDQNEELARARLRRGRLAALLLLIPLPPLHNFLGGFEGALHSEKR